MADNIVQFTDPIDKVTPSEQGEEAAIRAGRLKGGFFKEMGQTADYVVKGYQETVGNEEINKAMPLYSGAIFAGIQNINRAAANSDPNDPMPVLQAEQQFQDGLSNLTDQFHSPKGYEFAQNEHRRALQVVADHAVQVKMAQASIAAESNFMATLKISSAMALNDDTKVGAAITQMDQAYSHAKDVAGQNGMITTETLGQMQREHDEAKSSLVYQSAIQAILRDTGDHQDTDRVRANAANPNYYSDLLSTEQRNELTRQANEHDNQMEERASRQNNEAVKASVLAGDAASADIQTTLYNKMYHPDVYGPVTAEDEQAVAGFIKQYPHNMAQYGEMQRLIGQTDKADLRGTYRGSNPTTLNDMWAKAANGSLKPEDVTAAVSRDHTIDPTDGDGLLKYLKEDKAAGANGSDKRLYLGKLMQFIQTDIKSQLVDNQGLLGSTTDVAGNGALAEAQREAVQIYMDWTDPHKGKSTPAQAFDYMTNPNSNRKLIARMPYWLAGKASGATDAFFAQNPNPDAYVNVHLGLSPDGKPLAAPVQAPASLSHGNGESMSSYLARRRGGQ